MRDDRYGFVHITVCIFGLFGAYPDSGVHVMRLLAVHCAAAQHDPSMGRSSSSLDRGLFKSLLHERCMSYRVKWFRHDVGFVRFSFDFHDAEHSFSDCFLQPEKNTQPYASSFPTSQALQGCLTGVENSANNNRFFDGCSARKQGMAKRGRPQAQAANANDESGALARKLNSHEQNFRTLCDVMTGGDASSIPTNQIFLSVTVTCVYGCKEKPGCRFLRTPGAQRLPRGADLDMYNVPFASWIVTFSRLRLQRWTSRHHRDRLVLFLVLMASSYCCTHAVGSAVQRRCPGIHVYTASFCGGSLAHRYPKCAQWHKSRETVGADKADGDSKWPEASVSTICQAER